MNKNRFKCKKTIALALETLKIISEGGVSFFRLTKYGISANLPKSAESAIIRKSRFLAITFVKMLVFLLNFAQS